MSRYDGLIIPRSYSEYLNKTDSATLSQMLQHLTGLWSHAVSAGDNKPVTSNAVNEALTDAATIQQALQLPGVLSGAVAAGDNKAITSNAVNGALTDAATIQQALQLPGVLSGAVAAGDNKAITSNAVNGALANCQKINGNIISEGIDLDLLQDNGVYIIDWGVIKLCTNIPEYTGGDYECFVTVTPLAKIGNYGQYIKQELLQRSDNSPLFIRVIEKNSPYKSDWTQLVAK